jgi:hypothetical protein
MLMSLEQILRPGRSQGGPNKTLKIMNKSADESSLIVRSEVRQAVLGAREPGVSDGPDPDDIGVRIGILPPELTRQRLDPCRAE